MSLVRENERDSLMNCNIHGNKVLSSKGMVTFVSLLIRSIPKEYTLKSLRVQLGAIKLENIDTTNATKHFRRKRRPKR